MWYGSQKRYVMGRALEPLRAQRPETSLSTLRISIVSSQAKRRVEFSIQHSKFYLVQGLGGRPREPQRKPFHISGGGTFLSAGRGCVDLPDPTRLLCWNCEFIFKLLFLKTISKVVTNRNTVTACDVIATLLLSVEIKSVHHPRRSHLRPVNLDSGNGLVKMSASWSSVNIHFILIWPFLTENGDI
jgi:hypothetical protein